MRTDDTPRLRLAALSRSAPHPVLWEPDAEARARIARAADARALRKLRLDGALHPEGRSDWRLSATLGATVVQDCVVTTEPVTTRIDAPVERLYMSEVPQDSPGETEMGEDDDLIEPLPDTLDLGELVAEVLALELPAFPRRPAVALDPVSAAPPGATPITDADTKPFAGLAALRDKIERDD